MSNAPYYMELDASVRSGVQLSGAYVKETKSCLELYNKKLSSRLSVNYVKTLD